MFFINAARLFHTRIKGGLRYIGIVVAFCS